MKISKTSINGLFIITPKIFKDERGYFYESFNSSNFKKKIPSINFIQDNESKSKKGVLRGLHFQKPPYEQTKLVRCVQGEILDVAVDLRKNSKTFGSYESVLLSGSNKKQLFIPKGFAHGYVVLSNEAVFSYKVDNYYNPEYDSGLIWNDVTLKIDWKIDKKDLIISKKDNNLKSFEHFKTTFL